MNAASLLVAPAWVGDAVMSEPLIRQIAAFDQRPVDVLAPPWVAPLFSRMPHVGKVIQAPFAHGRLDFQARRQLGHALRPSGYRAAYVLPNSFKSALPVFFAGIPQRIGFTGECRYGLLNIRHSLDKIALPRMVDRFLALSPAPQSHLDTDIPQLSSPPEAFQAICTQHALTPGKSLAILCPGAEYGPAKRWPVTHFANLAQTLHHEGYSVWIVGSAKDAPLGAAISAQSLGVAHNLCGHTGLADAIDLLSQATVVVTNDSGLMHVAAALERPVIALFGSSSPTFTPPLGKQVSVVQHPVHCSPCFARTCRYGHLDCLNKLEPDQVMRALHTLVKNIPA